MQSILKPLFVVLFRVLLNGGQHGAKATCVYTDACAVPASGSDSSVGGICEY